MSDNFNNHEQSFQWSNFIDDGLSFINEMSMNEFLFSEFFQSNNSHKSSIESCSTIPHITFNFIVENNSLSQEQGLEGMSTERR